MEFHTLVCSTCHHIQLPPAITLCVLETNPILSDISSRGDNDRKSMHFYLYRTIFDETDSIFDQLSQSLQCTKPGEFTLVTMTYSRIFSMCFHNMWFTSPTSNIANYLWYFDRICSYNLFKVLTMVYQYSKGMSTQYNQQSLSVKNKTRTYTKRKC